MPAPISICTFVDKSIETYLYRGFRRLLLANPA